MSTVSRCQRALVLILAVLTAALGVGRPARAADAPAAGGYWLVGADGKVYRFGSAPELGSATHLNQPVVCMTSSSSGSGYWLVARDGGVFAFGDAAFLGSTGAITLNQPIVGMAANPAGNGYWLVASDGGIFAFGDAGFFGSTGGIRLNRPIVGMAATPSGNGYWLVASDGGIFAFGDAVFFGSTGAMKLNQPITSLAATPSGNGYWLAAADGGVFSFGDGRFLGSAAGRTAGNPVAGMAATGSGGGYWLVARDGGVYAFGDAPFAGSAAGAVSDAVVGIAPVGRPGGCGGFEETVDTLADRVAEASRYAAGRAGTAGFALIDTTTGTVHANGAGGVALRTASIVKVIIGMRLFARIQEQKRGLTAQEQSDLSAMIRVSDNDAASRLWSSLGGPAVITWIRKVTGVRNTQPPANPGSWGFTTTTARDMATILTALAHARGITPAHRDALLREMRQVTPSQRWGIAPAVHHANPAVKNGWYPDDDAPVWRVLCTGVVDHAGKANRWAIAVTTRYPANLGMAYGQETCSGIAARALPPDI
jgi:beta-lactamase family protein